VSLENTKYPIQLGPNTENINSMNVWSTCWEKWIRFSLALMRHYLRNPTMIPNKIYIIIYGCGGWRWGVTGVDSCAPWRDGGRQCGRGIGSEKFSFGNFIGCLVLRAFFDMHQISIKYTEVLYHGKVHIPNYISLFTGVVAYFMPLKEMIDSFLFLTRIIVKSMDSSIRSESKKKLEKKYSTVYYL